MFDLWRPLAERERIGKESLNKLPKNLKVTIHLPRQQIVSSQGTARSLQEAPRELVGRSLSANMEVGRGGPGGEYSKPKVHPEKEGVRG